jgi:hypothetical protein
LKITDSNLNPLFWTLHPEQQAWHHMVMPKRIKHGKRPKDVNQLAGHVVNISTSEQDDAISPPTTAQVSLLMSKLGKRGGKIGGKRRLETMTSAQRKAVARKAAETRWKKT